MEIASGVCSLSQFKGAFVHAYLLDDGEGLTIIDTLYDDDALGAGLNILFGLAVLGSIVGFQSRFAFGMPTTRSYVVGTLVLTLAMIFFFWRQEKGRPEA